VQCTHYEAKHLNHIIKPIPVAITVAEKEFSSLTLEAEEVKKASIKSTS